jgi:hypothetical protein
MPPPITATWKCCPSSGARGFVAKVMYFQLDAAMQSCSCDLLPKCLPTPRRLKCAPVRQFREGNYGTANVDDRTSNAVCSPGRQRKWAIACAGNRGRHAWRLGSCEGCQDLLRRATAGRHTLTDPRSEAARRRALRRPSLCDSGPSPCHRSARQLTSRLPLRQGPASAQAILIARIHRPLIRRFSFLGEC